MSQHPQDIGKVALLCFGGIGDVILFSPVIDQLRTHLPNVHITLFLEDRSAQVKDLLPAVDSVTEIAVQDIPRWRLFFKLTGLLKNKYFDGVISTGTSPYIPVMLFLSGIRHRIGFTTGLASQWFLTKEVPLNRKQYASDMFLALIDGFLSATNHRGDHSVKKTLPILKIRDRQDSAWARETLQNALGQGNTPGAKSLLQARRKMILLHPGVSEAGRRKNIFKSWSAPAWAETIQSLARQHEVFLTGGPDDKDMISRIIQHLPAESNSLKHFHNLYGHTRSLKQLAALIQACDLLISVDSGPMHMAVGLNTPVIALFGPTDEKKLLPDIETARAVTRTGLTCRPCLWDVRNECCEQPVCLNVDSDDVLAKVDEVFKLMAPTDIKPFGPHSFPSARP